MQLLALCGRFQSSGLHGMLNWFFTPKGDHNIRQSPIVSHEYNNASKVEVQVGGAETCRQRTFQNRSCGTFNAM